MTEFLPMNRKEMEDRGWDRPDFVYVCGDAYVDHPSFGAAIITRLLESRGYRVAFLAQPDWRKEDSVREFGEPRLGFLVSAGNIDSMVNHYSVSKRRRGTDAYSPGGQKGSGEKYRGAEVDATLIPKVKVEVVVSKIPVDKIIDTATKVLYTGHIGDGKIFVYNVAKVVKVRTGEANYAALQDVE